MIDLDVLERVGLFRGLTNHQLTKIEPLCESAQFKLDERILGQDDKAEYLYFVIDGKVDIRFDFTNQETSSKFTIYTVMPGQSFGWSSLVSPYVYSRSVFCATDKISAGKMEAEKLRHLFSIDNGIGYVVMNNLARVIAKRHRALQDEVVDRGGWA